MEEGDNILDAIYDEDNLADLDDDDVDMIDIEGGELVEPDSQNVLGQSNAGITNEANQESLSKNSKRRANKRKKNKRKRRGSGSKATDINRFVLDTCRYLKEKKSYMIDAIQACGGQKTADGRRFRTGGGILWNIIKVREPKAYKEIMKRAREFEKQFRQPNVQQLNVPRKENSSQGVSFSFAGRDQGNFSDSALESQMQNQHEPAATSKENSSSVYDRLRIPVSYDDDLLGENPINGAT